MARPFNWKNALIGGTLRGTTSYLEGRQKEAAEDRRQRKITEQMKIRESAKKTTKATKVPKPLTSKDIIGLIDFKMSQGEKLTPQEVYLKDIASQMKDEIGAMAARQKGLTYIGAGTKYNELFFPKQQIRQPAVAQPIAQPAVQPKVKTKWGKTLELLGLGKAEEEDIEEKKKDTIGIRRK